MKITFLVSHLLCGGAERTVTYLSSFMADIGWDVTVLSISDEKFYTLNPKVNFISLGVPMRSEGKLFRLYNAINRRRKVAKYLKNNTPDVLFCMLYEVGKYALKVVRKSKTRLIISERNNPASVSDKKTLALRNKIFSASDAIVFQTERAKMYYPPEYQRKSTVIFNAVGNELVYQCKIPEKRENKICAIGRLHYQKNYPVLLEAFKKVTEKRSDYILEIYGSGPERKKLIDLAAELNIEDKVVFMGSRKDAILMASNASCYVMSSDFEGMPNALMEAMAVGLPCISTDCPNGPAELIKNGENGLLVPVADSDKMADAILKMLDDKVFAESCGNKAKDILKNQNIDIVAKRFCDFITKVAKEGI